MDRFQNHLYLSNSDRNWKKKIGRANPGPRFCILLRGGPCLSRNFYRYIEPGRAWEIHPVQNSTWNPGPSVLSQTFSRIGYHGPLKIMNVFYCKSRVDNISKIKSKGMLDKTGYHFCFYFSTENMMKKIKHHSFFQLQYVLKRTTNIIFTNFRNCEIEKKKKNI